jgi:uncharacterized membrane protein
MAVAMHTLGTIALGAGLALTGQVFHLYTQWPLGILLWAVGAGAAWLLLEQWPQAALLAVLGPLWLVVAWADHPAGWPAPSYAPVEVGCCILAFVYLSACFRDTRNAVREALVWVGAVALVPLVIMVCADRGAGTGSTESWAAWSLAMAIPMLLALVLRGELSVYNLAFTGWVAVLYQTKPNSVMQYAWLALGAVGLVAWGILERRVERLNLGVAGFAITVLTFYFSSVMDKLGRSASLVSLGILFLAGGYALERLRRRLVASIVREAAE